MVCPVLAETVCSHWRRAPEKAPRPVVSHQPSRGHGMVIEKVPTVPLRRRQARRRLDADPAPGLGATDGTVQ